MGPHHSMERRTWPSLDGYEDVGPARGPEDFLLGRHVRRNPPDLRGWLNQKGNISLVDFSK